MQRHGRRPFGLAPAVALGLFLVPAAAALAVLAVRLDTVRGPSGPLHMTTGGESVSLLNVLKIQRGLPLYEAPAEPPYYPTALYNAGFYHLYAAAASVAAPDVAAVARAARMFTLVLACLGLAATLAYGFMRLAQHEPRSEPPSRWTGPAMAAAAVAAAIGGLPGWWLLSVRPDVGGAAFGAIGLAVALGTAMGARHEIAAGAATGLCLAAAWSLKQSCVLILAGLVVSALVLNRRRFLAAMLAPVAATAAAFALLLGPEYRYNTVFATSLAGFDIRNIVTLTGHFVVKGAFPLAASILGLACLPRAAWLRREERATLAFCTATTLLGGWAACYRNGSAMNYFFEFGAVAGFLAMFLARRAVEAVETRERIALPILGGVAAAGFACAAMDVGRLAAPGRLDLVQQRFDPAHTPEMERAGALARASEGPVYCQPGMSGLAWDLPFPVYTFDDEPFFHRPASRRGLLHGPGLMGLIAERRFRLLVLEPEAFDLLEPARRAGYVQQPGWPTLQVFEAPPAVVDAPARLTVNR